MRRDAAENQERVLAAAVTAMLRDGRTVPMSAIAAEAGVGVATLYRKYPNRDALLGALTERAFDLLAGIATTAHRNGGTGLHQLGLWWDAIIDEHDQLVLPLHGGPAGLTARARSLQRDLHRTLSAVIAGGKADGSIRDDVTLHEIIYFGVLLVSPVAGQRNWRRLALRHKEIHLRGLAGPAATEPGR